MLCVNLHFNVISGIFFSYLSESVFRDHHIVYLHKQMSSIFSVVSFAYPSSSAQSISSTQLGVIRVKSTKNEPTSNSHEDIVDAFQFFCYCNWIVEPATYTSLNCIKPFTHRIGYPNGYPQSSFTPQINRFKYADFSQTKPMHKHSDKLC